MEKSAPPRAAGRDEALHSPTVVRAVGEGRKITIEGFRSLGVLATFFAGLQVSMLSASLSDNSTTSAKFINAFWLAGTFLDIFGAVLSTLTARWLEVLEPEHAEVLEATWADRANLPQSPPSHRSFAGFRDWVTANALFSGLPILAAGVALFIVGLLIYIWTKQPLLVSILATSPVAVLTPLLATALFFPSDRKNNIIYLLAMKRGSW